MRGFDFEPTIFSPDERASIHGMKRAQERNLKRRKYGPKDGSKVIVGLAELLVMRHLADLGVPPIRSDLIAREAGDLVTVFAQECPGAIDYPQGLAREMPIKRDKIPQFLVWNGAPHFVDDLTATSYGGAWIVVDLKALAGTLVERAGRPLWTVVEEPDA